MKTKLNRILSALLIAIISSANFSHTSLAAGSSRPVAKEPNSTQVQNPSSELNVKPSQTFTYPDLCPTAGNVPMSPEYFYDNMESGPTDPKWVYGVGESGIGIANWGIKTGLKLFGSYSLVGPGRDAPNDSYSALSADNIILPSKTPSYLFFYHKFNFDTYDTESGYDGGVLEYSINHGVDWYDAGWLFSAGQDYNSTLRLNLNNPLEGRRAFSAVSDGVVASLYDLSSLAGHSVRFRWRIGADLSVPSTGWQVDNIYMYSCPNTKIYASGNLMGSYYIPDGGSTRQSYTGLNNGPVNVVSPTGTPIISSLRVAYNNGTAWTDFSEVMGMPANQATTAYWFPWYNNIDLNTQIRFANLGATATNIWVTIGGVVQPPFPLAAGQSTRVSYPISNGPVKVESAGGNIVASMRVAYKDGTAWTSFSEVMGMPANQLTTAYWFPWYNNIDLNTQIRFANLGATATNIWVTIGGVVQPPFPLAAGQSTRVSYPISNGPVKVESSMGNITASMRVAYKNGTAWTSFSEVMGLPANQATTAYWFPWYNNIGLNTQIRFANLGATATNIWVTIGGVPQAPIPLAAGQSTRVSYPINNGPVKVESSIGPITASMRVAYKSGTDWTSFTEVMGMPANQLTTNYWFPWYNNVDLNSQLRFGVP